MSTAPAARSLARLAISLYPGEKRSTVRSIAVFAISANSTSEMVVSSAAKSPPS